MGMTVAPHDYTKYIYDGLIKRGYNPIGAASLMGNVGAESSYNPAAHNSAGGGLGARGLFQWRGDRQRGLNTKTAGAGDDPLKLIDANLDFMDWEIQNDPASAGITKDEINAFTDPVTGAKTFRDKYERPGGHGYERTTSEAARIYSLYGQGGPTVAAAQAQEATKNPLFKFAENMSIGSSAAQEEFLKLTNGAALTEQAYNDALMPAQAQRMRSFADMYGPAAINPAAPGGGQGPSTQLGMPAGVPPAANTPPTDQRTIAMNEAGRAPNQPQTAAAPPLLPSDNPADYPVVTSTAGGQPDPAADPTEDADKQSGGFFNWLFPQNQNEADAEGGTKIWNRTSFRDSLRGLGVGLGQMSAGQAVDLTQHYSTLQAGRLAAAKSVADAEQNDISNRIAARNSDTAALTAETGARKAALDEMEALQKINPPVMDYSAIAASNPELIPLLGLAAQGDEEAIKEVSQRVGEIAAHVATEANPNGVPLSADAQTIVADAFQPGADAATIASRLSALPENQREQAQDVITKMMPNDDKPAVAAELASKVAELEAIGTPEAIKEANLIREFAKTLGGVDGFVDEATAKRGMEVEDTLGATVKNNNMMRIPINQMLQATDEIIAGGGDTGALTPMYETGMSWLRSLGFSSLEEGFQEATGISLGNLEQMSQADASLAMLVTRALMGGQGSVSDSERRNVGKTIASGTMTSATRAEVLGKTMAIMDADTAFYEYYTSNIGPNYENYRELNSAILVDGSAASSALSFAAGETMKIQRAPYLKDLESYTKLTKIQKMDAVAPKLTTKQAEIVKSALPPFWFNTDTQQYMETKTGKVFDLNRLKDIDPGVAQ